MDLPFSVEQFFDVFARYNLGTWPAPVVMNGLAGLALFLVYRGWPSDGRWVAAILALLWAWMGLAYHFAYFTAINPAAWVFGATFLIACLLFVWLGIVRAKLVFQPRSSVRTWTGAALIAFALIVYPALSRLLGHQYPAVPTFGLPCPTTIFTIGVLLLATPRVPRAVLVVPLLWAAVGSTAAFTLGVYQDLGLLVAGVVGLVMLAWPRWASSQAGQVSIKAGTGITKA